MSHNSEGYIVIIFSLMNIEWAQTAFKLQLWAQSVSLTKGKDEGQLVMDGESAKTIHFWKGGHKRRKI